MSESVTFSCFRALAACFFLPVHAIHKHLRFLTTLVLLPPTATVGSTANTLWFTALRLRLPTQNRIQHKLSIHDGSPFDSTLWRMRCTADLSASAETPCLKHWLQIIEPTPGFVNSNDRDKERNHGATSKEQILSCYVLEQKKAKQMWNAQRPRSHGKADAQGNSKHNA